MMDLFLEVIRGHPFQAGQVKESMHTSTENTLKKTHVEGHV